ncbi:hypothetical protein HDU96_008245 [Phlyctochytrium bullatum]|nr:hypothetical protein HDU96_008245 [Phlyctochytrium bullatum]
MNDLISLISKEDYFSLACISGECLHVTQIPGYTPPSPGTAFTPFVIGAMMVAGLGIVVLVLFAISWFQNTSERAQFQSSQYRAAENGDEEMEEMHRRAMMAGHTPCSLMFSDLGYAISTRSSQRIATNDRAAGSDEPSQLEADGENAPLLSEENGPSVEGPRRRNTFTVLDGVQGCVRPGEVMAIMGGSGTSDMLRVTKIKGAGKTTLLDILAKRNKSGIVKGKILVNGRTISDDEYKSIVGYVDQEDTLMDTLTVYETILYSALLRLPKNMSYEAKRMRVEETMMELDIIHIANRRIGKAGSRGISGGLDSYNAYNLVLLAKGKLVYSGPAQQPALDHFSNLGFNCPLGFNIADYLVDLTMHAVGNSAIALEATDTVGVLFDMFPLRVIPPVILGLICYHMIGLRAEDVWFLLRFLLVLILFNLTAASCCMMLSIVFKDSALASLIATLVMLFEMLFGGLLLNKGTVPVYARWLQTFSFFNCALEALVVNEVNGLTLFETKFGLRIDVPGAVILQTFGFNVKGYWQDVQRLIVMFFCFLTAGFLWLQFMEQFVFNLCNMSRKLIDVHTHVYLSRYMDTLRKRTTVPRVFLNDAGQERLIILPQEDLDPSTRTGRPIGPEYYDMNVKLNFMKKHGIDTSVVSLANPWLDFLQASEAESLATELNKDLDALCGSHKGKLFGFGVLPTGSTSVQAWIKEAQNISLLPSLRGAILGTRGLGNGLDDPELEPFYKTVADLSLTLFVHPHYGIDPQHFGTKPNGHVLPLALGFPFETTIAISRLILSGMLDRVPNVKLLLAHSGGTLPFLAGRLDSCVKHDPHVAQRLAHSPSDYLKRFYYDAVAYNPVALKCAADLVGAERLLFGTDNPFFPPLDGSEARWESVDSNLRAIEDAFGKESKETQNVFAQNAESILSL